jgi:hypothetical protein
LLRTFLNRRDARGERKVHVPLFSLFSFDIVDAGLNIAKIALNRPKLLSLPFIVLLLVSAERYVRKDSRRDYTDYAKDRANCSPIHF